MRRSTKSTFMPSIHVFPGGIADDADFSSHWLELFRKHGAGTLTDLVDNWKRSGVGVHMFSRERDDTFSQLAAEVAFRICAIRETFEECGVLLARSIDSNSQLGRLVDHENLCSHFSSSINLPIPKMNEWRKKVNEDAFQFITMCRELNIVPDIWTLHEWSNWLTPVTEALTSKGRRYDTAFFLALIEEKPLISQDDTETESALWAKPIEILQDFANKNIMLAPPQVYELSRLLNLRNFEELKEFNVKRHQRVQQFFPVRCNFPDTILYTLTGDSLYPSNPDLIGTEVPEMFMKEPFTEVSKKHPNRNCTQIIFNSDEDGSRGGIGMDLLSNIEPADGHIRPVPEMFSKLSMKSSL